LHPDHRRLIALGVREQVTIVVFDNLLKSTLKNDTLVGGHCGRREDVIMRDETKTIMGVFAAQRRICGFLDQA
jgi:hypothetical protein